MCAGWRRPEVRARYWTTSPRTMHLQWCVCAGPAPSCWRTRTGPSSPSITRAPLLPAGIPAIPTTSGTVQAAHPPAMSLRWQPASGSSHLARTPAARCGCRQRSQAWLHSPDARHDRPPRRHVVSIHADCCRPYVPSRRRLRARHAGIGASGARCGRTARHCPRGRRAQPVSL